jgi:hypothetical protein
MKWQYLTTAPDQLTAEIWQELLQNEGIPTVLEPRDAISFLGISALPCRLMVPEGLVKEALAILGEHQ